MTAWFVWPSPIEIDQTISARQKCVPYLVDTGTQRTKPARQGRWGEQRFDNEEWIHKENQIFHSPAKHPILAVQCKTQEESLCRTIRPPCRAFRITARRLFTILFAIRTAAIREYTMRHNCLCCLSLDASGSMVHVPFSVLILPNRTSKARNKERHPAKQHKHKQPKSLPKVTAWHRIRTFGRSVKCRVFFD